MQLRWFLVWFSFAALCTLFPFDFTLAAAGATDSFWRGGPRLSWRESGLNVLLFVPLGVLAVASRERRSHAWTMLAAAAGAAVVSTGLEALQLLLPARDATWLDVLLNSAGAVAGAGAFVWVRARAALTARAGAGRRPRLLAGALAVSTVLALLVSGLLQTRTSLAGWSEDYPLVVGNEATGTRPWAGRVLLVELRDAAVPVAAIRRFAAGEAVMLPGRRIGAYDLTGGPPYQDVAGVLPDLVATGRGGRTGARATARTGIHWLQTNGAASAIARRVARSDAFTLRVSSIASDIRQRGPARIVSNSPNISVRNFTLGQQGSDLVFRLRTALTGRNGARPEIVIPDVFATGQPRDVLVSYDGASVLVAAAGSNVVRRTDFTPGSSLALAVTSLPIRSADLPYLHAIYLAGLFLVPGVIIGALGHTPGARLALGAAWLVPFVLLLEATLVMVSGKAFTWGAVSGSAAIGGLVLPAVLLTMSGSETSGRYA